MILKPAEIDGILLVQSQARTDGRGSFTEMWNRQVFLEQGVDFRPDQVNVSMSLAVGAVRGMHWQAEPHSQKKLVRCLEGAVYDVVVDIREGSPTRGRYEGFMLDKSCGRLVYIPAGFAHGWQALEAHSRIEYLVEGFWNVGAEQGLPPGDPAVGIRWPLPVTALARRDQDWPPLGR